MQRKFKLNTEASTKQYVQYFSLKPFLLFISTCITTKKQKYMDNLEVEKSQAHIIVEIIDYVPHTVSSKTIIKKLSGNICIMSFDAGEGLTEKTSPFDTFVQIIDGNAEFVIDGKSNLLKTGQGIIIPAHRSSSVKANKRFKMILTVIKSGYE